MEANVQESHKQTPSTMIEGLVSTSYVMMNSSQKIVHDCLATSDMLNDYEVREGYIWFGSTVSQCQPPKL